MKKTYQIPSVVLMQMMPSTIVLAGSPGAGTNGLGIGGETLDPGTGGD